MNVFELLASDSLILPKGIVKACGLNAAFIFSQLYELSLSQKSMTVQATYKDMKETLKLSEFQLKNGVESLKKNELIKVERKGIPAKTYYKLNESACQIMKRFHEEHKASLGGN